MGDDGSKLLLAELLRESAESFGVRILAWVFMSNHLHLVVQSPPPGLYAQLTSRTTDCRHTRPWKNGHLKCSVMAQFMRRLRHRMSILRQRELGLTGRFWGSSYDSRLIQDGTSLVVRIAYDHRNPVQQGMALRPEDYVWSSARQWVAGRTGPVSVSITEPLPFGFSAGELREDVLKYQHRADLDVHATKLASLLESESCSVGAELRALLAKLELA